VSEQEGKHEIVIIRRGGHGHEEGHHGGMWKIAYADFMTAMMALFLVLWLVNSTDEKTVAQIATYFNPIDLSDRITTERGVEDKKQAGTGMKGSQDPAQSGNTKDDTLMRNSLERAGNSDQALFSDPYEVLAKIAEKAPKPPAKEGKGGASSGGQSGDAFRDPFDPDFRANAKQEELETDLANAAAKQEGVPLPSEKQASGGGEGEAGAKKGGATAFEDKLEREAERAAKAAKEAGKSPVVEPEESRNLSELKQELFRDIRQTGLADMPDVTIKETGEGILISVTDKSNFEMFALSSAEPKAELVVLMEQLAAVLAKQPGKIVVRGHTDARPFKSKTYDNWRLSTARAHIAQYMLQRGGLAPERVERIEGYADHALKNPQSPNAPENRRIEILLKPEKT
jgi:chemotaxis protein MotB